MRSLGAAICKRAMQTQQVMGAACVLCMSNVLIQGSLGQADHARQTFEIPASCYVFVTIDGVMHVEQAKTISPSRQPPHPWGWAHTTGLTSAA